MNKSGSHWSQRASADCACRRLSSSRTYSDALSCRDPRCRNGASLESRAPDRGLLASIDRYEAKYGSGRVDHAPRRASASRDRPSSGDSNASHADDRACADQTRPSASTTVLFADLLSPEKQYALLQRPEDSRALPSAGAGCPSAHTRLPSRLPLNPFQALARRVQRPVPLGHRGQRHADRVRRRAVAQTALIELEPGRPFLVGKAATLRSW